MANTVIALKKSATPSATPSALANGELAINYADGKLYYKNVSGFIVEYNPTTSSNYFGTVNANTTLLVADSTNDVLTIAPGNNISIVGDAVNDKLTISVKDNPTFNGDVSGNRLISTSAAGDEGGEIVLATALTNNTLSTSVTIDIYQNRLRFFETGGTNRGAFLDIGIAGTGVSTNLLASGSSTDTTARDWASAAFAKANTANTTADLAYTQANNAVANLSSSVTLAGNITFSKAISEKTVAISGTALNPSNGTVQYIKLTTSPTFTDSISEGQFLTLMINAGTSNTVTWPTMKWIGNSAPTLATTGTSNTALQLWKLGGVLYGARIGDVWSA